MKVTFSCLVLYFLLAARGVRLSVPIISKEASNSAKPNHEYKKIIKSIYGDYTPEDCCWTYGPQPPELKVNHECQSESVRQEIEYNLSQYPAVEQALMKSAMNCENNHWGSEGLSDSCPSEYLRATQVRRWGILWYIVRPNVQCVTYRKCYTTKNCATASSVGGRKRSPIQCSYGSDSTCLPDGYRTFQVWIYCSLYGFRLVDLELPQCCSCKRYNSCGYY
ncbi:uncharacterized protein LOC111115906 [Crassostrea virginica]|uniref:Uncharacterized protein LOC111115906 isoform X1 n=1 Tax=Crassostrea virginica TaxID=6565 RepID=A0A8B8C6P1_CRAVI|nr:uncharacterized protein LOC111115906 isoform X1 [Crassostrea virginica]